jgi:hypothetical protein
MTWTLPILRSLTAEERYQGVKCDCNGRGPRPHDGQSCTPHPANYSAECRELDTETGELGARRQRYLCVNGAAEIVHRLDLFHPCFRPDAKGNAPCVTGKDCPCLPPISSSEPSLATAIASLRLQDVE